MKFLLRIAAAIDALNTTIGRWMSWLILFCTLTSAVTATLRYTLDWGSNALLEAQWFMFGLVFLFCSAWTLWEGGHVRIDILHAKLPPVVQIWIEILGALLFLLPACLLIAIDAWNYFLIAFQTREASPNPGGLLWWPLKLAIPVAFVLLSLQGISETIKNIAILTGDRPLPVRKGGH
ncbi:TRAP transporter small permease subunit [Candidatus Competibacter phosphatis]|uniref:TRAP transporter small permease protein n=1 Tax=Candidatus Competibacter phosphatis TaxID=221280 RepID=A0ABX1TFA1_9GAMM|nr:TRAP transporter small permease subunit [Candidatus Competibacter phosphatis]NMQ18028.1 TRAP transporter small permease subunit [Candidatus Competibacter phosphatis]